VLEEAAAQPHHQDGDDGEGGAVVKRPAREERGVRQRHHTHAFTDSELCGHEQYSHD
jgi:hypothetical protein